MEETQYRFYRLRDEVTFYIASTPVDQLDAERIKALFGDYQQIWDQLGARWLEFRQSAGSIQ
ncbi:hypothetical protein Rhe02_83960 [Rhizocola hellebori]|uniref:Uncharacterized protein n=2 Tax=Rhizocola hellebori TaxID=1392758 RepID=A0A8J3VKC7_9ACTN|nr:hypothetical protein Rhe02_83960 [Rhizocola hellebori]